MTILLLVVVGLVIWSLRLMQGAIHSRDFSLGLASSLVAVAAAGVVIVYVLMDGCLSYFTTSHLALGPMEPTLSVPAVLYEPDIYLSDRSAELLEHLSAS